MAGLDVGGDWYDLIALPDDRVGIALGDVVGRGVAAAATMGKLRTAMAALAPYCSGPGEVLQRLDLFAGTVTGAELATVAYLDFDPATGALRYSCAGHPPPVLVTSDGARFLRGGRGIPLATANRHSWEHDQVTLTGPALVICYSDGLIERRGTDIDTMLELLRSLTSELADRPVIELCESLLERMVGESPLGDDIALLCVSVQPDPVAGQPWVYHRILAAEPGSLAQLRRELGAWGADLALEPEAVADLVLATDEACANAIEHAYQGVRPAEVEVRVWLEADAGQLVLRVTDTGRWRDRVHERSDRGRGLGLIRATMTEVDLRGSSVGTTVIARRDLDGGRRGTGSGRAVPRDDHQHLIHPGQP